MNLLLVPGAEVINTQNVELQRYFPDFGGPLDICETFSVAWVSVIVPGEVARDDISNAISP